MPCDPCAKKRKKRSKGKTKVIPRAKAYPGQSGFGVPLLQTPSIDNFIRIQASIQNINDNLSHMTNQMKRGNLSIAVNESIQGNSQSSPNIPPPNFNTTPLSLNEIRSMRLRHMGHLPVHHPTQIEIQEGIQGNSESSPNIPPPEEDFFDIEEHDYSGSQIKDIPSESDSDKEHPEKMIPLKHARAAAETDAQLAINDERRKSILSMQKTRLRPILKHNNIALDESASLNDLRQTLLKHHEIDIHAPLSRGRKKNT